jgi:malonate transporter MadL subunit
MAIYGTAILAFCLLVGVTVGRALGWALGMDSDVGGVGIAMLLLIVVTDRLRKTGALPEPSEQGILFWSSIYIPVIVAMAASQNVRAAIHGGPAALLAGTLAVVACVALVPVYSRMARGKDDEPPRLE